MARAIRKHHSKAGGKSEALPLDKTNFRIIGAGLLVIALGYLAMSEKSVEGFLPITVAPILLVIGYCVVIPIGILYHKGIFSRSNSA